MLFKIQKIARSALMILLPMTLLTSCYYDRESELNPEMGTGCDTSMVTYAAHVVPLMAQHCNSCHSTARADAGVVTDTHQGILATVNNGSFMGSMRYLAGFSPMPKGAAQLTNCDLDILQKWIDNGALQN